MKPWIVSPRPQPSAALRLLCFPFAGGGTSAFRTWPSALPADVEVLGVELPGRESRLREQPFADIAPLIQALTDAIAPLLTAPFAIFGHSLGAVIGFHFARELRRRSLRMPAHLFVSGRRAPQLSEPSPMRRLPDPDLIARLRRLGGISDVVMNEPELMAYFLPILRADISVVETAPYREEPPLDCPITALGGTSDEKASLDELDAWRLHTRADFERVLFPGGHFYIQTARDVFLAELAQRLERIAASCRRHGPARAP